MADRKSPSGTAAPEAPPRGRHLGPEDLKAFTHPLRMAMYAALNEQGPATATQLARRLGESSGQTSYHLRQLERHGFVEDDPEHAGGRERWWRSVGFSVDPDTLPDDPATTLAVRTVLDQTIADRARVLRRFADSVAAGQVTVDETAQVFAAMTVELTHDETAAVIREVQQVLDEHADRAKARRAAGEREGRRRTRIYFDVLPLPVEPAPGD